MILTGWEMFIINKDHFDMLLFRNYTESNGSNMKQGNADIIVLLFAHACVGLLLCVGLFQPGLM